MDAIGTTRNGDAGDQETVLLFGGAYPDPRVTASSPTQFTLAGDLTLHGVTRLQSVAVRVSQMSGTLRGQGETTVKQSDYGIRRVSVAGGMLKVKDEVRLTFDIVAGK